MGKREHKRRWDVYGNRGFQEGIISNLPKLNPSPQEVSGEENFLSTDEKLSEQNQNKNLRK